MSRIYTAFIVALFVLAAGAIWYTQTPEASSVVNDKAAPSGSYAYTCDKGIEFIMTPAEDMLSISLTPIENASYPPASVLADSPTDTGRRYRNADFEFHGQGESVTLYVAKEDTLHTCLPQPKPDEPPFNWGD